ncbi:MAG: hypothetical protein ACSW8I_03145 [bacterium]
MKTLEKSPNSRDRLVEGYSINLDGNLFHIFVMEELTGTCRGYIIKLMLGNGDNTSVDLQREKSKFPEATGIMKRHLPDAWVNKGKTRRCYKYIVFGHGEKNMQMALVLLHTIIDELGSKKGNKQ